MTLFFLSLATLYVALMFLILRILGFSKRADAEAERAWREYVIKQLSSPRPEPSVAERMQAWAKAQELEDRHYQEFGGM